METQSLKNFAINARNKLLEITENRINYLISEDYKQNLALYDKNREKIEKIRDEFEKRGDEFIEEVAYTWFNRFIAIRFMEANGITECEILKGNIPEILTLAKIGELPENYKRYLSSDFDDLLNGQINVKDVENEIYKRLFLGVCNYYNTLMPYIFENISDYTELLLSDNLLALFLRKEVVEVIEDGVDVEVIGWLYQFYISEKKDEAMSKKSKYFTEEIPAVTQIFTPKWIVKYLVENSLGRLWIFNRDSDLKDEMNYFIDSDTKDIIKVSSVEDIKVLDPCCGSGHMLVYAFDLLTKIYEEEGYSKREIPKKILENNIFGCDIDKRASVLATFALHMKARLYYRRFFNDSILPNIIELQEYGEFENIKDLGSLLKPKINEEDEIFKVDESKEYKLQKYILSSTFDVVVTNPPYMGNKGMNDVIKKFLTKNYPDSKSDLFAVFIERGLELTKDNGFLGMITMQSWMFLSSYEKLRVKLLRNHRIDTLVQLGPKAFDEIGGEVVQTVAFVLQKGVRE